MSSSISDILSNGAGSITTSTAIQGKNAGDMGMDEFFNLLVAQMTNQDMMNPTDNTEFIAQMAQFTALQGVKNIQEYQLSSYAVSYTGKNVTIASINDTTGDMETITGLVESVTFYDGKPQVVVNGKAYELHTVMQVNAPDTVSGALNQASNYIGKNVTLTDTDKDGFPFDVVGLVSGVTLKGGVPHVLVNGEAYPASSITDVEYTVENEKDTDDE